MYNEPNIGFWRPKPDVKQYVKLALAVGKALREAEPEEVYIGPATSTINFKFLEECFKSGLLEYWKAVSVHPYRQTGPETAVPEYARLRKMIAQYAPHGKTIPIISGEWGYSSAWKDFDEARQGRMLARELLVNLTEAVPVSIWYDWHDDGPDPKEPEHHFGTVLAAYHGGRDPAYDPKPAYRAMKTLAAELGAFSFAKRVPLTKAEDYVLAFVRGNETRWAVWTTSASPQVVSIPVEPGRYRVTGHVGEPLPAIVTEGKMLEITLTDAPKYLAREK